MKNKIKVGVIGATGMVGQNYIRLLDGHPWFDLCYVAASPRSAGKTYKEAVAGRWLMDGPVPEQVADRIVQDAGDVGLAAEHCAAVFSAVSLEKEAVRELETDYARHGLGVISNNSAHRYTGDVPILIPEINPHHVAVLEFQKQAHGFQNGFITVKPNCSIQSYMIPIHALRQAGFPVNRVMVTTIQSMSGAGYPGPSGLDMVDNIIPFIPGEDEKSEEEPKKIFGHLEDGQIAADTSMALSAQCNRGPIIDGHLASVSIGFENAVPGKDELAAVWKEFKSYAVEKGLPSAPDPAIIYFEENNRPQPRKDRNAGNGMAVSVGRLKSCSVLDYRFVGLSHNTVRGAAGGAILMAELVVAEGYLA
ncbi:MAG: aspartate-semialdehyde dehydrogenase [bacterium]|nr:aspartate-semialdehyde dehydrogenase [bacterium]